MNALDYEAPATLAEAVALLGQHGASARVLAGGTDVIIQHREGRRNVGVMVDVKHIPKTMELKLTPDGACASAPRRPARTIYERTPRSRERFPALIDSASLIGGIQIQSRASLGGNLCNSSPAADSIPTLIVLGAVCEIAGPKGRRTRAGRGVLHRRRARTCCAPDELLVALVVPGAGRQQRRRLRALHPAQRDGHRRRQRRRERRRCPPTARSSSRRASPSAPSRRRRSSSKAAGDALAGQPVSRGEHRQGRRGRFAPRRGRSPTCAARPPSASTSRAC